MASQSVVDQIVKSLSFEVEAVPQHQDVEPSSSSNMTPMNVKIKVRKKHESDMEKGIMSVQKSRVGAPQRIRLVSSDQTIMSFDVLMEAEFANKIQRKPRKNFFGGCLGTQYDDDDGPYEPSSTYNAKKDDSSISSKSEGVLKHNFTLLKHQRGKSDAVSGLTNHSVLGKCKPGGCLDPPFGEDRYPYKPVEKNDPLPVIKDDIKDKTRFKGKTGDDSLLRPKGTDLVKDSIGKKYSASIITYPPEGSSTENIQDKLLRSRLSSATKQRKSATEGPDIFYSPAKKTRADSRDRKFSHEASSNTDMDKVGNRQKLNMITRISSAIKPRKSTTESSEIFYSTAKKSRADSRDRKLSHEASLNIDVDKEDNRQKLNVMIPKRKKEVVSSESGNKDDVSDLVLRSGSWKSISLDQNVQEGKTKNKDRNQRKQSQEERRSASYTNDFVARSSNTISSEPEEHLKSKDTKSTNKVIPLVIPIPLAGEKNLNVKKTRPEHLIADENQKKEYAQILNDDQSSKQEEVTNIDENIRRGSVNGSTDTAKAHEYSILFRNKSKDLEYKGNEMTLTQLREPASTGKDATKHSSSSEIFSSGESNNTHSYDNSKERNVEGKEKSDLTKKSLKQTLVDISTSGIPDDEDPKASSQKRLSKSLSSEYTKLYDNKHTLYFEKDYNSKEKIDTQDNDYSYLISADPEQYSRTRDMLPEFHPEEKVDGNILRRETEASKQLSPSFTDRLSKTNVREDQLGNKVPVDEKILRRETVASKQSWPSYTGRFSKNSVREDQFSERENLQNKIPSEDDLKQRFETNRERQTEDPINKKQNIFEIVNDTDSRPVRKNLSYLQSESSDYTRGIEQENLQDSNHLLNKYTADYYDSASNTFSKPTSDTMDGEYLSDHSFLRPDHKDYETTNIHDNQIPPTKFNLRNLGQSLESAAIRKLQDKVIIETSPNEYELRKAHQSSAPPSVFDDDIAQRDYNRYSKQYEGKTSDIASQRSIDNIASQTQEIDKPLIYSRYSKSSSQSSMSATSKQYERFGKGTKEFEYAPQNLSGSTERYEDIPQYRDGRKTQDEDMRQYQSSSGSTRQYERSQYRSGSGSTKQYDEGPQFRSGSGYTENSDDALRFREDSKRLLDDNITQNRDGSTKQFEETPKYLYEKPIDSKYPSSDTYKNVGNEQMYAPSPLKSSMKNDLVSLNLGFKSYENDKKERILETFNTSDEPTRKPDETVTVIRSVIRPQINDLTIPIDSDNEMSIQIRRNKSPLKVQIQGISGSGLDKFGGKIPDKETQDMLNNIYERDLIPLHRAFIGLKRDLDVLSSQKHKLKDKSTGARTYRTTRVVKVKPKCNCWENW